MTAVQYDGTQNLQESIVRFTAEWCGPCKLFAPLFNRVAEQDKENEYVVVDVDEHPDVAGDYGVLSIPAVFEKGDKIKNHMDWAKERL